MTMLTAQSPIIAPASATVVQCSRWLTRPGRTHGEYSEDDIIGKIVPGYADVCASVGVNVAVVIAQLDIESNGLNSALSQRRDKDGHDLRNPAGIGVWEGKEHATKEPRPNTVYDADVGGYRPCCQFTSWMQAARAHIGRLIAWATVPSERTPEQVALVNVAMAVRPLDAKLHGSARQLIYLGAAHNPHGEGWAYPGIDYGAHIARTANAIAALH